MHVQQVKLEDVYPEEEEWHESWTGELCPEEEYPDFYGRMRHEDLCPVSMGGIIFRIATHHPFCC